MRIILNSNGFNVKLSAIDIMALAMKDVDKDALLESIERLTSSDKEDE